jgi:penicillin-insensitive murein endopeptidase
MRFLRTLPILLALTSVSGVTRAQDAAADPSAPGAAIASAAIPSAAEVERDVDEDVARLGPMSLGLPHAGALINGVQMQNGDHWDVMQPATAWATRETIDALARAVERLQLEFPGSHKLFIGDIARVGGGHLRPHASHQTGRDVDVSYYYRPGYQAWYQPASSIALDRARSWAFVRALLTETDVEVIFIDMRVQRMLYEHAARIGEDRAWLDGIFGFRGRANDPIIKHAFGHATHMHVRFYNPRAQRVGRLAYDRLVQRKLITPRNYLLRYQVRPGDTAESIAARAGSPVKTLRAMNAAGSLRVGQVVQVPMRGQVAAMAELVVPARRLPPSDPRPHGVGTAAAAAPDFAPVH